MTSTAHDRVVRYLAATGWLPPDEIGQVGGLWRHPTSQHLLPVPNELVEGGIDWQVIAERVGMLEGATAADVAARLGGEYGHKHPLEAQAVIAELGLRYEPCYDDGSYRYVTEWEE